jgi:raffinose synthase
VGKHFGGEMINCMSNGNDMVYHCHDSNLMRSSGDFYPNRASSHSAHIFHNAVNSIWLSRFVWCDWDMFQTSHLYGPYHAAARAVSGSPVYVSDRVDAHDFDLIRSLTDREGKVMLALDVAMPTEDCLFADPSQEKSLYKIFNRNRFGSVIGVFAFGGEKQTVRVSPADVPGNGKGTYAAYSHRTGETALLTREEAMEVSLEGMQWDIITFAKVEAGFAILGLTEKLNCGGAVKALEPAGDKMRVQLADRGTLLFYREQMGFRRTEVPETCEVLL